MKNFDRANQIHRFTIDYQWQIYAYCIIAQTWRFTLKGGFDVIICAFKQSDLALSSTFMFWQGIIHLLLKSKGALANVQLSWPHKLLEEGDTNH